MGVFVSIRGWIETCDEQLPLIRALIQADDDDLGHYTESWCFPTAGGGYSRFAFFGCTVRESAVAQVRAQVRRIAETIKTHDGPDTDYPEGDFLVEHESHEGEPDRFPLERWRFRDGKFSECRESDA